MKWRILSTQNGSKWWRRALTILSCFVVFATVYLLILPAITVSKEPLCGIDDHTHTAECFEAAGVAGDSVFLEKIPKLSGNRTDDFLKIAKSQIGYLECPINEEDGSLQIYNMYSANFGNINNDWDAAFVAWCLQNAKADAEENNNSAAYFPKNLNTQDWINQLKELSLLKEGSDSFAAEPGDMIFFSYNDERQRVGIVSEYNQKNEENSDYTVSIISGDWDGLVDEQEFSSDEIKLIGFARISSSDKQNQQEIMNEMLEGEDNVGAIVYSGDADSTAKPPEESNSPAIFKAIRNTFRAAPLGSTANADPLPLGDTDHYGEGAGYVTEKIIYWRNPDSADDTWKRFTVGSSENIPANAEFRMQIKFIGVNKTLLKEHGYLLEYEADSILTNFSSTGVIRNENGSIVGEVSASGGDGVNQVLLDFSRGADWLDGLNTVLESEFYYQGHLDLKQLQDAEAGIINIAGIDIQIPDAGDAIAQFASVELEKETSGLVRGDDGHYYIEYTLKVTAGEYGCPDLKVIDTLSVQGNKPYLDGYVGVSGQEVQAVGPSDVLPLDLGNEEGNKGTVFLTNTTPNEIKNKTVSAPVAAQNGSNMAWVLGSLEPNESRTLTYRVAVNDSYVGIAHQNEAINNTASLFSKNYERGTKVKSFSPTATASISKARVGEARVENGKYIIDYEAVVTADRNNDYPMTDLKVYDFANQYEGTEYAGDVRLVDGSVKLYTSDNRELNLSDYTTYTDASGAERTRLNPRPAANNRFDVFIGDLEPGQSRKIRYTLELDIQAAQEKGNGALGIFNRAYVFSDEVRQNKELSAYGIRDVQSYNQWVEKSAGNQTSSVINTTFPRNAEIYDATANGVDPATGLLPMIDGVDGYTVPAGAYAYTVNINKSGVWDVTTATWRDGIQASDSAGNRYLRFTGYARVDVYDKLVDSATGQAVARPDIKKTVWVKIDGDSEFAFTGKQIGLDGSDAYQITYYAEAILPPGVSSYGTINANNRFSMSGTVGNGEGVFINPNISSTVTVTAKEPGVNDPVKIAWYYDDQDNTFEKYHDGKSNGALYWIIKISGDKIPRNMQFQESTRVGGWNNYLRNNESLLGFYLISFPEGTNDGSNANEFLERYKTFADFEADLHSEESNISVVPKTYNDAALYTDAWSGYTDKRYGENGQHFDLTLKFEQDYTIPANQALYLLIKTDPVDMPGNGETKNYANKCNYRTDAMGNITSWPNTQTSQNIYGPEGSLQKSVSQITDTYTKDGRTYSKGTGVYRVSNGGSNFEFFDLSEKKFNDYTKTSDFKRGNSSNGSTMTFQTKGTYLKNVSDTGVRSDYVYEDGTYLVWNVIVNRNGSMSGYTDYWIEDELPDGLDLAYVRTSFVNVNRAYPSGTGDWARSGSAGGPENIVANANAEWVSEGWTQHRLQHTVIGSQANYNWTRYGTVYYTKDNLIRLFIPQIIGNSNNGSDRVEFQIVCRLNDASEAELTFGDVEFNNQATLYDMYKNKVESSGSEILVSGGNVNKQILMDGKFNQEDESKLSSTVFPYRLEINNKRVDMAENSDTITLPLHDRMTGNMSMELDTLRIYAVPEGKTKEDTSPAGDADLLYYGGNYTTNANAQGHFWYTEDRNMVGRPIGYCGDADKEINILVRPAVDEDGAPIIGQDGSQMHEVVFENLPDATHLVITYSVSVKLKDGNKLIFDNKAFWENHEDNIGGESDSVIREYQADGSATSAEHGAVHIVKHDAESYTNRLQGAEFELYRAEYKTASAGKVYIGESTKALNKDEVEAGHYIAVFVGNDYSLESDDREIACRRSIEGELLEVRLPDSSGKDKWMTLTEAYSYGYTFHHEFDTDEYGNLKLCRMGPVGQGETDVNGNLSYGFGSGKDFGRRFNIVNGEKVYLDESDYAEDRIHFNKVYAVKESKAPYGYEIDENPYFFVVPNERYNGYGMNYFYHETWPDEVHICTLSENGEITYMLNVANSKKQLSVTKDFAGSIGAAQPGTYTFGIWETSSATKNNMLTSASITYTADDFGWFDDDSGNQVYGVLPEKIKTVSFPNSLDYGEYYIYELNSAGNPIKTSGNVNGYMYTPQYSGESVGNVDNALIFDETHTHIEVTNRGYSIDVEKNFLGLDGDMLDTGLRGIYRFAIWEADALDENGVPRSNERPIDIQEITWERGDTQASKKATFSGLSKDKVYHIFELDTNGNPVPDKTQVVLNDGSYVVYYSEGGLKPADNEDVVQTVSNAAFVSLPQTGGIGTNVVTFGGITLMGLACLGYIVCILRQRRRKGTSS